MNFARKLRASALVTSVIFAGAIAFAAGEQSAADDPGQSCGGDQTCVCQKNAEAALRSDCLDKPPNPLVSKDQEKQIDDTQKLIGQESSGAKKTCTKLSETNTASIALLQKIQAVCAKRMEKCPVDCKQIPEGPQKQTAVEKCEGAKAKQGELANNIAHLQALEQQNESCNKDVSGEDKDKNTEDEQNKDEQANKDGGGGGMPQLPQMPQSSDDKKNPCADPTSAQCQQLVQDCNNEQVRSQYAYFCSCNGTNASSDPNCNKTTQVSSEPEVPTDSTGGTGGGYQSSPSADTPKKQALGGRSSSGGAAGGLPMTGGGGAGFGGSGGANTPDGGEEADDPNAISANILGSGGGGGGGGGSSGGSGGGSYSADGNWIPAGLKGRGPAAAKGKKQTPQEFCDPNKQPAGQSNFARMNWSYVCVLHQEPR